MNQNLIDRALSYIAPGMAVKRTLSRAQFEVLGSLEPLRIDKRGQSPMRGFTDTDERLVNSTDRQNMHKLIRIMCKENPVLDGIVDRMVNNVIPADGILPNATTDDAQWNQDCEDYYAERCEVVDITERMPLNVYQKTLLRCFLKDGDFFTVFTNVRKIQGIEAHRCATPRIYSSAEDVSFRQGVKVTDNGVPISYFLTRTDKYGNLVQSDFRQVFSRDIEHSFTFDRFDQWRGITCLLSSIDNLRDMMQILTYEKFRIKLGSALGMKLTPADSGGSVGSLPFPGETKTDTGTGKKQTVTEMFPGALYNLGDMGLKDLEMIEPKRDSINFQVIVEMLARLAGLGVSLPIELVLLDFTKGNMASARAALMEARKAFFEHYSVVKRFSKRHYKWIIEQGVSDGVLVPPASIKEPFRYLKHEWTQPVWNYLDPLNELEADAKAIGYTFQTFDDVAKRTGKDDQQIVKRLAKQWDDRRKANCPVILGQPGDKTIQTIDSETGLTTNKKQIKKTKTTGDQENE